MDETTPPMTYEKLFWQHSELTNNEIGGQVAIIFWNAGYAAALRSRPEPLPDSFSADQKGKLLIAWRENLCGDHHCEARRFFAAIWALRGGKTHIEYATRLAPPPREAMDAMPAILPAELGFDHPTDCGNKKCEEFRARITAPAAEPSLDDETVKELVEPLLDLTADDWDEIEAADSLAPESNLNSPAEPPRTRFVTEDICACGDYRSQHPDDGPCSLNGLGHGIPRGENGDQCQKFRLSGQASRRIVVSDGPQQTESEERCAYIYPFGRWNVCGELRSASVHQFVADKWHYHPFVPPTDRAEERPCAATSADLVCDLPVNHTEDHRCIRPESTYRWSNV